MGLVTGVARCGNTAFLAEADGAIRRIDLSLPSQVGTMLNTREIQRPSGLAVDCKAGRLYVLDAGPPALVVIDLRSGLRADWMALPDGHFAHGPMGVDEATGELHAGGLWWPIERRHERGGDPARFYQALRTGFSFKFGAAEVRPLLDPYELQCRGWGACADAAVDHLPGRLGESWVMALPTSERVAVYDTAGHFRRAFNISSPLFLRDGRILPPGGTRVHRFLWGRTNSVIQAVFATADLVATIHSTNRVPVDWNYQWVQFDVRMNLHRLDGTPVVVDLRLVDLPVGRDDSHAFVIDYGSEGRGSASRPSRWSACRCGRRGSDSKTVDTIRWGRLERPSSRGPAT